MIRIWHTGRPWIGRAAIASAKGTRLFAVDDAPWTINIRPELQGAWALSITRRWMSEVTPSRSATSSRYTSPACAAVERVRARVREIEIVGRIEGSVAGKRA